jgi:hypothetical protein
MTLIIAATVLCSVLFVLVSLFLQSIKGQAPALNILSAMISAPFEIQAMRFYADYSCRIPPASEKKPTIKS